MPKVNEEEAPDTPALVACELLLGDCRKLLYKQPPRSFDAICTDPPYGLNFMGAEWDAFEKKPRKEEGTGGAQAPFANHAAPISQSDNRAFGSWCEEWASACLRVLKPGGYMACFGGTRTWHRLACGVEDAGFEIRDTVMWLYAGGFPKSDGCLKPAHEPVLLCRKPGPEVLPLGIEECRVGVEAVTSGNGQLGKNGIFGRMPRAESTQGVSVGRWPANVAHDGSEEVMEAFAAFGRSKSPQPRKTKRSPDSETNGRTGYGAVGGQAEVVIGDEGTPARFFFCSKASTKERNEGLEGMPPAGTSGRRDGSLDGPPVVGKNHHPTVKPLKLMEWLLKLLCGKGGGRVLDPFLGSGSTGVAAAKLGLPFLGIEKEEAYLEIAKRRIAHARKERGNA